MNNTVSQKNSQELYSYVKRSVPEYYIKFPEKLSELEFNNLGKTYEDFLLNKWVLLSKEQAQFHEDNPSASIEEVFNMELKVVPQPSEEDLINRAKSLKLNELRAYDNSSEVNEFSINGEIKTWFTPDLRANYKNSIDSAKLLGIDTLQLLVETQVLELPTDKAAQLLAMIQLYADSCYIVTKQHEGAILLLDSVEAIESYDYKTGYPKKLNFDL